MSKRSAVISRTTALRLGLGGLGLGAIAIGILGLPTQLEVKQLIGLASWLAAALVLHDGMLVPLSHLLGMGLRRFSYGLRPASAAVIRTALLVGAVLTLIGIPLLKAQQVAKNLTVLQDDYTLNLIRCWIGLAVLATAAVLLIERHHRAVPEPQGVTASAVPDAIEPGEVSEAPEAPEERQQKPDDVPESRAD